MFFEQKQLRNDLKTFLLLITALLIIGLLFIYSSSSVYALEKFGSASYFVKKQLFGIGLGCIGLLICRFIPLDLIKNLSPLIFCSSLFITILTLFPAISTQIHGSRRWLFFYGFGFQPSELLKISSLMYISYFLTKKEALLHSFRHGYLPFITILGLIAIVLLRQPDFGMTITLLVTSFLLFLLYKLKQNILY